MRLRISILIFLILLALGLLSYFYFGTSNLLATRYDVSLETERVLSSLKSEEKSENLHLSTPEPFKAIYMSQCVAGTPSFRNNLVSLIDETELNAVIIDVKDFSGKISFVTDNPELKGSISDECRASDMRDFIKLLHEKEIYVVGRITVFQDPFYSRLHPELAVLKASDGSVWKDRKGLSFIDVGAKAYWDYIVVLSEEAYELGFDELNYDYIRFPSDGDMKDIAYPHSGNRGRANVLEEFFSYLDEALSDSDEYKSGDGPILSADLFGYTTTNTDDLGIGQILERTLPYFDYVMPMVYPSHYNPGFIGITKPAAYPYEVIKYSMDKAVLRAKAMESALSSTSTSTDVVLLRTQAQKGHGDVRPLQLRTWIQDFDLGATYTPEMVRKEIQATYDAGLTSWALWDAGNTYTRAALNLE